MYTDIALLQGLRIDIIQDIVIIIIIRIIQDVIIIIIIILLRLLTANGFIPGSSVAQCQIGKYNAIQYNIIQYNTIQ